MTWIVLKWVRFGNSSVLVAMTGMVTGLGMIGAGAGFVSPFGAIMIGIFACIACFFAIMVIKKVLRIDDSPEVF